MAKKLRETADRADPPSPELQPACKGYGGTRRRDSLAGWSRLRVSAAETIFFSRFSPRNTAKRNLCRPACILK